MRVQYNQELTRLNNDLVCMGAYVERTIQYAGEALATGRLQAAEQAVSAENEVDRLEQAIEARSLRLLLQQQPVASDLRLVSAALKMITDMERIGDQAANIAEMSLRHPALCGSAQPIHIAEMVKLVGEMVKDSVDAFVTRDLALAKRVCAKDDEVDRLFYAVRDDLILDIRQKTGNIETAFNIFMIAKYLERIGDHSVNISYWVRYAITGEQRGEKVEEEYD